MKKQLLIILVLILAFSLHAQDERKLLLHWSFDDGTATDLSGNGHDGELHNVQSVDDIPLSEGKSMYFNGADSSYIINESVIDNLNGLEAFTVSMWVKSDTVGTDRGFIICDFPKNRDQYLTMRYDMSGYISQGTHVIKVGISLTEDGLGDTIEFNIETLSELQTTDWQHLVFCWEAGDETLTLFIDGGDGFLDPTSLIVKSAPSLGSIETVLPADPYLAAMTELYIGKGGKDKETSWKGYIDEVLIYNFKATSDEAEGLYDGVLIELDESSAIEEAGTTYSNIKVLPNPLKTSTQIEFSTASYANVSIEICDFYGKSLEVLTNKIYQPGIHSLNWTPTHISPGIYFGRVIINDKVETVKIVIQ
jgi:hypothetical protein